MLDELVCGREAAEIMDMTRSDDVWRAVERHGADYPGRIDVLRIGRTHAARRDELHRRARRGPERPGPGSKPLDERRAKLRAAIDRVMESE